MKSGTGVSNDWPTASEKHEPTRNSLRRSSPAFAPGTPTLCPPAIAAIRSSRRLSGPNNPSVGKTAPGASWPSNGELHNNDTRPVYSTISTSVLSGGFLHSSNPSGMSRGTNGTTATRYYTPRNTGHTNFWSSSSMPRLVRNTNVATANSPHPSGPFFGSRYPCYSLNLSDTASTGSTMWRQHATTPDPPSHPPPPRTPGRLHARHYSAGYRPGESPSSSSESPNEHVVPDR